MAAHAFTVTVKVMVKEDVAYDDMLLDEMASFMEDKLELVDETMSVKFGNKYDYMEVEID